MWYCKQIIRVRKKCCLRISVHRHCHKYLNCSVTRASKRCNIARNVFFNMYGSHWILAVHQMSQLMVRVLKSFKLSITWALVKQQESVVVYICHQQITAFVFCHTSESTEPRLIPCLCMHTETAHPFQWSTAGYASLLTSWPLEDRQCNPISIHSRHCI